MTVPIGTRPVTLSLSPAALDLVPDSGLRVVVCRVFVLTPGQLGKPSRLDWETGHRLLEMGNGKWTSGQLPVTLFKSLHERTQHCGFPGSGSFFFAYSELAAVIFCHSKLQPRSTDLDSLRGTINRSGDVSRRTRASLPGSSKRERRGHGWRCCLTCRAVSNHEKE